MSIYQIDRITDIIKKIKLNIEITAIYTDIRYYDKRSIPDSSGIYILENRNGERYIGSSVNILIRQRNHHIKNVNKIDVILIKDVIDARTLESILIYVLEPELNKLRPQTWIRYENEDERVKYLQNNEHEIEYLRGCYRHYKYNSKDRKKLKFESNYTKYSYSDLKPDLFTDIDNNIETVISNFTGC